MLISEFERLHSDILLDKVLPGQLLDECVDGTSFFLVSGPRSSKPVRDRPVLHAKYAMPVSASLVEKYVVFLCLTDAGYPKSQVLYPRDLDPKEGIHALYRVRPMPPDDPRRGKPWKEWPAPAAGF